MLKRNCSDRGEGFGAKEKTANLSSQLITNYKSDSKFKKRPLLQVSNHAYRFLAKEL